MNISISKLNKTGISHVGSLKLKKKTIIRWSVIWHRFENQRLFKYLFFKNRNDILGKRRYQIIVYLYLLHFEIWIV